MFCFCLFFALCTTLAYFLNKVTLNFFLLKRGLGPCPLKAKICIKMWLPCHFLTVATSWWLNIKTFSGFECSWIVGLHKQGQGAIAAEVGRIKPSPWVPQNCLFGLYNRAPVEECFILWWEKFNLDSPDGLQNYWHDKEIPFVMFSTCHNGGGTTSIEVLFDRRTVDVWH